MRWILKTGAQSYPLSPIRFGGSGPLDAELREQGVELIATAAEEPDAAQGAGRTRAAPGTSGAGSWSAGAAGRIVNKHGLLASLTSFIRRWRGSVASTTEAPSEE